MFTSGTSARRNGVSEFRNAVSVLLYLILGENQVITPPRNSSKNGKYKFPKVKVNAVVMEEKEEDRNRRDPFFGPFSDFFRQPEYNHIKQSATSPATPFEVVSPPRKSSEQLRHEGKMLI